MRQLAGALVLGLVGVAVLVALGVWQLQRLAWKEELLSRIEARIHASPVPLPARPDPERDRFLPVRVSGRFLEKEIHVLTGSRQSGPGFRLVTAFETDDGRRIMVDRGFIPEAGKHTPRPGTRATIVGHLDWPEETDPFTPEPDRERNIWFARDVDAMARALGTEPVLLVLAETDEPTPAARPIPVDTASIPNDHLQYAITWFLLAAAWAGMTGLLVWRIRRAPGTGRS